jgi:transcriptional regulator with XRE-family HTH domain
MKFTNLLSNDAVTEEIGRRIAAARLERQMTQAQLAEAAGISKRTVERLEDGESTQLANLIRCLRALDKLEGLERLLPETPINPIEQLKGRRTPRQRARSSKGGGTSETAPPVAPWTWGDRK